MHQPIAPFKAWSGPRDAKLVLVGEAWGQHEFELKKPFVGESGKELWRLLGEAFPKVAPELHARIAGLFKYGLAWVGQRDEWLAEASIAFTNVLNLRPNGNKIPEICLKKAELPAWYDWPAIEQAFYLDPQYLGEVERLRQELEACRPNLVVACGGKASWALLRSTKISSLRGAITQATLVPGQKLLPTYHPAAILRQWSWRPIVLADLMKASREMGFAEFRRPSRQILFSPTLEEVLEWTSQTLSNPPLELACDTETKGGQVSMISFARQNDSAIVVPFIDESKPGWSYWASPDEELAAWNAVERLLRSPSKKIWQNGLYDLQYLLPLGLVAPCDEDTMLQHHSILPEMQKGLGFLGSVYTSEPSWKLMRKEKADTEKRDE